MLFGERAQHMARVPATNSQVPRQLRANDAGKDREHHEEEICRRPCRWGCGAKLSRSIAVSYTSVSYVPNDLLTTLQAVISRDYSGKVAALSGTASK